MLRYGQRSTSMPTQNATSASITRGALRATTRRAALLGYQLLPISNDGATCLPKIAMA